jgi:hypothetical protein
MQSAYKAEHGALCEAKFYKTLDLLTKKKSSKFVIMQFTFQQRRYVSASFQAYGSLSGEEELYLISAWRVLLIVYADVTQAYKTCTR